MREDNELLLQAAGQGDLATLQRLLAAGCDVNGAHPVHGNTALYNACFVDRADVVKLLVAGGADPNHRMTYHSPVDGRVEEGLVALMLARSPAVVSALLEAGANPNVHDAIGRTPLMRVVLSASVDAVDLLLAAGADPTVRNQAGLTAADIIRDRLGWLHESWVNLKQPQATERKAVLQRMLATVETAETGRR